MQLINFLYDKKAYKIASDKHLQCHLLYVHMLE